MLVKIYTDGAARGNPDGPGGYGTILSCVDAQGQEHIREFSQGYKKTTNNRMELMAAIVGLEALNNVGVSIAVLFALVVLLGVANGFV